MYLHKNVAVIAVLSLSACGWVDSTGKQEEIQLPALIDPSLEILRDGDAFAINENTQKTIVFSGTDNRIANWRWSRLDGQADIQRCASYENFDQNNALNTLQAACTSNSSCDLSVAEITIDDVTRFEFTTPQLRAPAALEYRLTAQTTDGRNLERNQLVCAIPINDAPDAKDDPFSIMRGTVLIVDGNSADSLLANDSDDQDIRNQALRVETIAVTGPRFAADFELFADGGFYYEPLPNAPLSSGGSVSDRFTYSVTDGTSSNTATVSIKITEFNTAPVQTTRLPEVNAFLWEQDNELTYASLSQHFSDAEEDTIVFTAKEASLPESGNVYLTDNGLLKGNAKDSDSGRYFVELTASDSIESIDSSFYLNIVRTNGVNKAPYANDISNATVSNEFSYDITGFFEDADEDHMTFTATGLPEGVSISPDGIISGTVDNNNRGRAFVRVTANDGNGGESDDGFRLTLR